MIHFWLGGGLVAGELVDSSWLDKSVYAYHQPQHPHTKASVCYHWAKV